MNFNSLQFLIYLPIVLIVYFIIPHRIRWIWLLLASYYFYMSFDVYLVFLILATTVVSYGSALIMDHTDNTKLKKLFLVITLIVCLGLLAFFKYFNFLFSNVVNFLNLFSMNLKSRTFDIILPVGISFYTFQTLSYVIDVYKGKYKAEKHFGYYALFVSFFPQLVAGPIERPDILIPQLKEKHTFNFADFACGFRILVCGFLYKCVVADFVGIYVNKIFADINSSTTISLLLGGLLFCIQMYGDFNGYSEIAIGSARMMGIKLSRNFNRPYLSLTYGEFFRRWHITLNTWFTDYLYIPLGGNRKGKARQIFNTFIVFFLCGLWHGASWTYVLWGLYAAFFVCIESLLKKPVKKLVAKYPFLADNAIIKGFRHVLIMLIFVPAALVFRASDLSMVKEIFVHMFTDFGNFKEVFTSLDLSLLTAIQIVLCILALVMIFNFGEIGRKEKNDEADFSRIPIYVAAVLLIAFSWLSLISLDNVSDFAYFQF